MTTILKPALLSLCITAGWAHAQQPLPSALVQAAQTAIVQSPDMQERWKALLAARQNAPIARAGLLPQVDLQAYVGRQNRRTPSQSLGTYSISGVELTLNQLLFDGGIVTGAMAEASENEIAAYHDLMGTGESVALRVVQAYLDLLRMQERVALATENYVEHKRTFDAMTERSNAAVGRRVDTDQAQGRLAVAESTLTAETTALREAGLAYQRFVGQLPPATLALWPEGRGFAALPASVQNALQQGLTANPLVRSAYHRWKAAEQAVAQSQARFMPRVDARVSVGESRNQQGQRGEYRDQMAEIRLSQNLYRGGADTARQRQNSELQARSRADLDAACREVQQVLSVAYNDVQTLRLKEKLVDSQRLAVEVTTTAFRQQFDIGQRTLLDVLDTQTEYFETARNYVNVRHDQLRAEARTLAAMGQLVPLFGATPAGEATTPAGADVNLAELCPVQTTFMDDLERIKAGLTLPQRAAATPGMPGMPRSDYTVLLPDADGSVGQVIVSGPQGQQTLRTPMTGADMNGAKAPYPVSEAQLKRDFGAALDAQPTLPERFTLYFDKGSTRLSRDSETQWAAILNKLQARQAVDLTVAGHTDTVSTPRINEALALRRARTIAARLRASGLKATDIVIEGYGARRLEVATPPQTNEPRNRRVVIIAR